MFRNISLSDLQEVVTTMEQMSCAMICARGWRVKRAERTSNSNCLPLRERGWKLPSVMPTRSAHSYVNGYGFRARVMRAAKTTDQL